MIGLMNYISYHWKKVITTGIVAFATVAGLNAFYYEQMIRVQEMNRVLDAKRSRYSDKLQACRNVYLDGGPQYEQCCDDATISVFGKELPHDIEQPYKIMLGIYDVPFYENYVNWRTNSKL